MAQDSLQRVQQLIAEGRYAEARAILQTIDRPEVAQLLAALDEMEKTAAQAAERDAETAADDASDFLSRLSQRRETVERGPTGQRELLRQEGDRRVYDQGTYEMLWDCQFCGTEKLLGVTHRFCPNCGAPQNPKARYYPAENEMVAVEDHQYVGEDRVCPACDGLNSGQAEFCGNCGNPLTDAARATKLDAERRGEGGQFESSGSRDVVKEGFQAEMQRVGVAPQTRRPVRSGPPWLPIGLVVLAIAVCVGLGITLFATSDTSVIVMGRTWERTIQIEQFSAVETSAWCDSVPGGAYSLTQRREIRSYRQIPDGERCETVRRDNGDGTFRMEQQCTTIYRDEPVYDQKCYFLVNTWAASRQVAAEGESREDPYWPTTQLACAGQNQLGCEREAGRNERYELLMRASEGDGEYTCPVDFDLWQTANVETRWNMEVGAVLGDARCDTLTRAR